MSNHVPTLRRLSKNSAQAVCPCGWEGPERVDGDLTCNAFQDAQAHQDGAQQDDPIAAALREAAKACERVAGKYEAEFEARTQRFDRYSREATESADFSAIAWECQRAVEALLEREPR